MNRLPLQSDEKSKIRDLLDLYEALPSARILRKGFTIEEADSYLVIPGEQPDKKDTGSSARIRSVVTRDTREIRLEPIQAKEPPSWETSIMVYRQEHLTRVPLEANSAAFYIKLREFFTNLVKNDPEFIFSPSRVERILGLTSGEFNSLRWGRQFRLDIEGVRNIVGALKLTPDEAIDLVTLAGVNPEQLTAVALDNTGRTYMVDANRQPVQVNDKDTESHGASVYFVRLDNNLLEIKGTMQAMIVALLSRVRLEGRSITRNELMQRSFSRSVKYPFHEDIIL